MDTIDDTLAEVVKTAVSDADLNGKAISSLIGIPYSTWRRKAAGLSSFSMQELHRVAKVLGVKVAGLVADAERKLG